MSLGMVCAEWLALCMFHNNFRKRIDVGEFVGKLVLGFFMWGGTPTMRHRTVRSQSAKRPQPQDRRTGSRATPESAQVTVNK